MRYLLIIMMHTTACMAMAPSRHYMLSPIRAPECPIQLPATLLEQCTQHVRKQLAKSYGEIAGDIDQDHQLAKRYSGATALQAVRQIAGQKHEYPLCTMTLNDTTFKKTLPHDLLEEFPHTLPTFLHTRSNAFAALLQKTKDHCIDRSLRSSSALCPEPSFTLDLSDVPHSCHTLVHNVCMQDITWGLPTNTPEYTHIKTDLQTPITAIRNWDNQLVLLAHNGSLDVINLQGPHTRENISINPALQLFRYLSPHGSHAIYKYSNTDALGLFCVQYPHRLQRLDIATHGINTIAVSPDDSLIALAHDDIMITLLKLHSNEHVADIDHGGPALSEFASLRHDPSNFAITQVALSTRNRILASALSCGIVYIWKRTPLAWRCNGKIYEDMYQDPIHAMLFSPNEQWLMVCAHNGTINCFNVADNAGYTSYCHPQATTLAISSDSRYLASGGEGIIMIYDVVTKEVIQRLHGSASNITSLLFTPDNLSIVAGHDDGTLDQWSIASDMPTLLFCAAMHRAIEKQDTLQLRQLLATQRYAQLPIRAQNHITNRIAQKNASAEKTDGCVTS